MSLLLVILDKFGIQNLKNVLWGVEDQTKYGSITNVFVFQGMSLISMESVKLNALRMKKGFMEFVDVFLAITVWIEYA